MKTHICTTYILGVKFLIRKSFEKIGINEGKEKNLGFFFRIEKIIP